MCKRTHKLEYILVSGKAVCSERENSILTGSGGVDVC